jgi:PPOX class probable F420-dependent enzyme
VRAALSRAVAPRRGIHDTVRAMATPLDSERYISLETFRKDGTGVRTPVWVAPLDGKLVVFTNGESFKVKRLRNNPKARVAGCDMRGQVIKTAWHDGQARIVEDPAWIERAHRALIDKYGWQVRMLDFFARLGGRIRQRAYLEITI